MNDNDYTLVALPAKRGPPGNLAPCSEEAMALYLIDDFYQHVCLSSGIPASLTAIAASKNR